MIIKGYLDKKEAAQYLSVSETYLNFLIGAAYIKVCEMPHMREPKGKKRQKQFVRVAKKELDVFMASRIDQVESAEEFHRRAMSNV